MRKLLLIYFIFILVFNSCKDDDTVNKKIVVKVNVKSLSDKKGINAYIFLNDSLYGTTDSSGSFSLSSLNPGNYALVCSAINYRDTSVQVTIGNDPVNIDFYLAKDSSVGKVYGEFQDMFIYEQKLIENPEISTWDEKQKFDAVTGATFYSKPDTLPARYVIMNNDTLAVSDGFGQYWFKIQCGTYYITGMCNGYSNSSGIIKVLPGSKVYRNFYMQKK